MRQIISDTSTGLHNDLWNAITDMFEKDGIDYMNEKDVIRIGVRGNTSTLFYKDKPYCMWSDPVITTGCHDEFFVKIRCEIKLIKL